MGAWKGDKRCAFAVFFTFQKNFKKTEKSVDKGDIEWYDSKAVAKTGQRKGP